MSTKFVPTEEQKYTVKLLACAGIPQEQMAKCIINPETGEPIAKQTLADAFRHELDTGLTAIIAKSVAVIAKRLGENDLGAACFVLKTRAGWSERPEPIAVDEERLAQRLHELSLAASSNV